ncbi:hypothetical protein JG688_00005228, partial [Phytophthora aleatoria]
LIRYVGLITTEVEQIIISVLLPKFGIIFDGWSFHSEHYVTVFSGFDHDGHAETVILSIFNRTTADLLFATGDNCSTNWRVATLLGLQLVGCASRRLHSAVKSYLASYESLLSKVNTLMGKLRCINAAAKLRLLDVRDLFNAVIDQYPSLSDYLSATQPSCTTQSSRLPV